MESHFQHIQNTQTSNRFWAIGFFRICSGILDNLGILKLEGQ